MAQKTIPQLNEIETIDENAIIPIDTGIQSYKITAPNLAKSLDYFITSGAWSSTKEYVVGNEVFNNGIVWKCVQNNTNKEPISNDGEFWIRSECEEKFDWKKWTKSETAFRNYFTKTAGSSMSNITINQSSKEYGFPLVSISTGTSFTLETPLIKLPDGEVRVVALSGYCAGVGSAFLTIQWYDGNKSYISDGPETGYSGTWSNQSFYGGPSPTSNVAPRNATYYKVKFQLTSNNTLKIVALNVEVIDRLISDAGEGLHNVIGVLPPLRRSGGAFQSLSANNGKAVNENGSYACGISNSSFLWWRAGESSALSNPSGLPTVGIGTLLCWSHTWKPDIDFLVITQTASPYVSIFKRVGNTLTKATITGALSGVPTRILWSKVGTGDQFRCLTNTGTLTLSASASNTFTASTSVPSYDSMGPVISKDSGTVGYKVTNMFGDFYYSGTPISMTVSVGLLSATNTNTYGSFGPAILMWVGNGYWVNTSNSVAIANGAYSYNNWSGISQFGWCVITNASRAVIPYYGEAPIYEVN